jgi:hypothetical protein
MLVFSAPLVAVFAVARARTLPARLPGVVAGLVLGTALAACQLLPAIAHARLSPRALPLGDGFAGSYAWPSLRYAVTLLYPLWYGDDARGTYGGAPDQWELSGYGAGVAAALFFALAFARRRSRAEHLGYLALVGVAVVVALGPSGPLWPLVRDLPLVGRTRCPARALFLYTLTTPLLVAAGVDRVRAALPRRLRPTLAIAPLAIALELLVTLRAQNPTVRRPEARLRPAVLDLIPPAPSGDRTLIDVHLGQAFHNGGPRWGIETPGGYSSLPLWRYLHLLWIANHGRVYPSPSLAHDLSAQGLWRYDSPLVDLLGVRRALVPRDRPISAAGWHLDARGSDGVDLWLNDEALPRAFFVPRVQRVHDARAAADAIADPAFSPLEVVVLEETETDDHARDDDHGHDPATVHVEARPSAALITVEARRPGVLVVSLPYEPAWRARLDGAAIDVLPADLALLALRVPDGKHEITLERRDPALRLGVIVSIVAVLLCAFIYMSAGRARSRNMAS